MKYTRAPVVKLKATMSHLKDSTSTKHTNQWHIVPKRKITGHPQSNKHVFHVKHHVLCKRTRKLYLKCRIANCKQAYRLFHSVQALNVHHRIFHPRILFRCRICPKIHHTLSLDWYHKYEHQQSTFSCPKCDKSFVFNSKLQQHRRVHITQRLYRCFHGGCTKSYKHPQDLARHTNSHLPKNFECPICDYTSDQKCLLKRHSEIHQTTPRYQCKKSLQSIIYTQTKVLIFSITTTIYRQHEFEYLHLLAPHVWVKIYIHLLFLNCNNRNYIKIKGSHHGQLVCGQ